MNIRSIVQRIPVIAGIVLSVISCKNSTVKQGSDMAGLTDSIKSGKEKLLFVGTYTGGPDSANSATGIYLYAMNSETGALKFVSVSPNTTNPSFLAIHPNKKWIYAVNETGDTKENPLGGVSAFRYDAENYKFEFINSVSSHGTYPCNICVDQSGKYVMVANYGSGNVTVYPIGEDGRLKEASFDDQHIGSGPTDRQKGPHAHMVLPSFIDHLIYSVDLGIDKILLSKLDTASGKLIPTDLNTSSIPGAGPRQLTFHPNHKWAYVVNELNGTVEAFNIDTTNGALTRFQAISTVPDSVKGKIASADIHITPSGKYLYASNRADVNSIAMYKIDQNTGKLEIIGYQSTLGRTPRNFVIDPSGTFLLVANKDSGNVVTFRIDPETGRLNETGIITKIPKPVCLKFY